MGTRRAIAAATVSVVLAGCELVFPLTADEIVVDARPQDGAVADATACVPPEPGCAGVRGGFKCDLQCYSICTAPAVWATAQDACQLAGAELASIADPFEDACLKAALATQSVATAWVGLTQAASAITPEAQWSWTDGTPYVGFGWRLSPTLQPNDADNDEANHEEQCAYVEQAGWGDRSCVFESFAWVCGTR